MPTAN